MNPNKVFIVLPDCYTSRKVVIIRSFDEGACDRAYDHFLVVRISMYPKKVNSKDSTKKKMKKYRVKVFIKLVNYNHIMPTHYTLDVDLKEVVTPGVLQSREKKITSVKKVKTTFEERFKIGKTGGSSPSSNSDRILGFVFQH